MRRTAVSAVQFAAESVSSLRWNHCPVCGGISVQFGAEYAAWAAFGIYANSIYHHHIKKKIAVVQSTVRAPNVLTSLGNKGGVNAWVSWVGIGLIILSFLSAIVLPPTESTTTASTPNRVSAQNTSESVEPPVVSAVSHQDAVSSIASGWVLVERFSDADVYADSSSISRTGDLVDMWALVDYKTAIVDEQSDPYKSFMALSSYDCRTSQIKVRGFRAYAQNMGRGRQVMAYFDPSSGWSVVTSSEMSRWKYACGKQ